VPVSRGLLWTGLGALMAKRREFTRDVKAQIVLRATNADGQVVCEGCGIVLGKKPYHIDHTIPDALTVDKSRKLTAGEGKLLGKKCCHDPKTRTVDVPAIAKAKAREAKHLGITRPAGKIRSAPFPKSEKPKHERVALAPRQLFSSGLWPAGGRDSD
jgi:hypothetical protein